MTDFGNRLSELRRAKKLSQDELADKAGVSKEEILNLETKSKMVRSKVFIAICKALDMSPDEFLDYHQ